MRKKTTDCGKREFCLAAYAELLTKYAALCEERDKLNAKLDAIRELLVKYEWGELDE